VERAGEATAAAAPMVPRNVRRVVSVVIVDTSSLVVNCTKIRASLLGGYT
jgi:hypothetical protein